MMLSFCCFCTRDFRAPLIGLGDGSVLPTWGCSHYSTSFQLRHISLSSSSDTITTIFLAANLRKSPRILLDLFLVFFPCRFREKGNKRRKIKTRGPLQESPLTKNIVVLMSKVGHPCPAFRRSSGKLAFLCALDSRMKRKSSEKGT